MSGSPSHPRESDRVVVVGTAAAFGIVLLQALLLWPVRAVDPGLRAQAFGVCLTTAGLFFGGILVGSFFKGAHGPGQRGGATRRGLEAIVVSSLWLAAFGSLRHLEAARALIGRLIATHSASAGAAWLATDGWVFPSLLCASAGVLIGQFLDRKRVLPSLFSVVVIVGFQLLGGFLVFEITYDPQLINILLVTFTLLGLLGSGFFVAVSLRRLAFVELLLGAVAFSYALYLTWLRAPEPLFRQLDVPKEQLLVGMAIFPGIFAVALLAVGASFGFLITGGGRFDPRFGYEVGVAFRYLRLSISKERLLISLVVMALLFALLRDLLWLVLIVPSVALAVFLVRRGLKLKESGETFIGVTLVISVMGVSLGVMALIVVLSVMSGFEQDLKQKILGAHAHIVVGKKGDDFTEYAELEAKLKTVEGVVSASSFVLGEAMISAESGLSGVVVKGIEPENLAATKDLRRQMTRGDFFGLSDPERIPDGEGRAWTRSSSGAAASPGAPVGTDTGLTPPNDFAAPAMALPAELPGKKKAGLLIGRELAKALRVYVGDTVSLVSPISEEIGPTGPEAKLRRYRVAGIFYSGMFEFDSKFAYLELKEAQKFFGKRGKATGIELRVAEIDDTQWISEILKRRIGGHPYSIKDWRDMNKELFSALLLEKLAMFIILTFIVLVASFNIVSTLVMIVLEKGREIAILKSMGATEASIMKIFVVQGVVVGVGGAVLGLLGGVGLCAFLQRFGVELDPDIFYIDRLPVVMDYTEIVAISAAALILTYLATIYPAMAAAALSPVEGLRDD